MKYLKIFGYEWLEGSIRRDLTSAGRGIWADILALASISRRFGYLERSQGIPYTDDELADKFKVDIKELQNVLYTCIQEGRLQRDDTDTLFITNWNRYQDYPLGTSGNTKKPKPQKPPQKTEAQRQAILRAYVNKYPDVALDVVFHDYGYEIINKNGGEIYDTVNEAMRGIKNE